LLGRSVEIGHAALRFFFHIRRDGELVLDDQGTELPDIAAARREAEQAARELLAEAIKAGYDTVPEAFVIADEHARPVETLPLVAALPKFLKK
jgi:hypothetical protein